MKKLIYAFCTLGFIAFTSCSKDDSTPVKEEVSTTIYEGKWKMVTGIRIQDGQTFTEDLKDENCDYDFYDFKKNGLKDEIYHDSQDDCSQDNDLGTWSYDVTDKTITTIDTQDNYKRVLEVIEISSSSMKLKLIEDDGDFPEQFGVEIYMILKK